MRRFLALGTLGALTCSVLAFAETTSPYPAPPVPPPPAPTFSPAPPPPPSLPVNTSEQYFTPKEVPNGNGTTFIPCVAPRDHRFSCPSGGSSPGAPYACCDTAAHVTCEPYSTSSGIKGKPVCHATGTPDAGTPGSITISLSGPVPNPTCVYPATKQWLCSDGIKSVTKCCEPLDSALCDRTTSGALEITCVP